jgi:hypothetical protein
MNDLLQTELKFTLPTEGHVAINVKNGVFKIVNELLCETVEMWIGQFSPVTTFRTTVEHPLKEFFEYYHDTRHIHVAGPARRNFLSPIKHFNIAKAVGLNPVKS